MEKIYRTLDESFNDNVNHYVKAGYSDAYTEAVIYGKYKHSYSMKDINLAIEKYKKLPFNLN